LVRTFKIANLQRAPSKFPLSVQVRGLPDELICSEDEDIAPVPPSINTRHVISISVVFSGPIMGSGTQNPSERPLHPIRLSPLAQLEHRLHPGKSPEAAAAAAAAEAVTAKPMELPLHP
jgi:hypothetical protein